MKTIKNTYLIITLLIFTQLAAKGQEIFRDDFNAPTNSWSGLTETGSVKINDGLLLMNNLSGSSSGSSELTIPIDWSKDFSIKTSVKLLSGAIDNSIGFIFSKKPNEKAGYIYGLSDNGHWIFWQYEPEAKYHETGWQQTSLVHSKLFNTLEVQKIGSSLYFFINDQVVHKQESLDKIGDALALQVCKGASVAFDYITVNYLSNTDTKALENELSEYKSLGIRSSFVHLDNEIQSLQRPSPYFTSSNHVNQLFYPESNELYLTMDQYSILYDLKNRETNKVYKSISSSNDAETIGNYVDLVTDVRPHTLIKIDDKKLLFVNANDIQYFDGYDAKISTKTGYFIGMKSPLEVYTINDDKIEIFNLTTQETTTLFKLKRPKDKRNCVFNNLSNDKKYLLAHTMNSLVVFNAMSGEVLYESKPEDKIKITYAQQINSTYDGLIILEKDGSLSGELLELNPSNGTIKVIEQRFPGKVYLHENYVYHVTGAGIELYDLRAKKFITKQPIPLPQSTNNFTNFTAFYYPELNQIYISGGLDKTWYVSNKSMTFSALLADISTGEITPLLFHETSATQQKQKEKQAAEDKKNKANVDALFAKLKPFGSYFKFNYGNFPYVSIVDDPILKKGYISYVKAIGKFCDSFGGGSILALRENVNGVGEQYIFELIHVSSNGNVRKETLGVTQKIRGQVTQLCDLSISKTSTGYTITTDTDGRIKTYKVSGSCN